MPEAPSHKRPAKDVYVPPAKRTSLAPSVQPIFPPKPPSQTLWYHWDKSLPKLLGGGTLKPYCFLDLACDANRQIRVEYQASHVRGHRDHDLVCIQIRPKGADRSRKWSSIVIDRLEGPKPIYPHVPKHDIAKFLVEVCGKLGQAAMAPATRVALRNAVIAHHHLDPKQVHYFLENPTIRGNPSGDLSSVSYVSSIAYVDENSRELQNIQVELGVDQVAPDAEIPKVPAGIRWVQGGVRTDNVHLRQCDFGHHAVPAAVAETNRLRHERCVDALRWLIYVFDGSCGSARTVKQQLWEAQRLLSRSSDSQNT